MGKRLTLDKSKSSFLDVVFFMTLAQTKDLHKVARWFHALANETRLRIIELLGEGEQCVWM